jgi:aspartate/methionine/tyrosine aminotransferase
MLNLNTQFELIRQSATVAMADRILALKASGRNIIGLQVGDPDFGTPPAIGGCGAQSHAIRADTLRSFARLPRPANCRCKKLSRDEGVTYDPDTEILITHGGIHAYYLAMQSILTPGDDVLIPDPSWATHSNMAIMLRGNVIRVPAPAENGFIPLFDSWLKALTPKTRVIVLNYPSNPTGAFPSREYLQNLQDFAAENNLWIVSDEVYGSLYYEEKPTSAGAIEGAKDRTHARQQPLQILCDDRVAGGLSRRAATCH